MKDLFPFSQHISTTHFPYFFEDGEITRQISILFFSRIEVFVSTLVHYLFMVRYRNSIAKSEVTLFFFFPSRQQVKIDFGLALQIQKIS